MIRLEDKLNRLIETTREAPEPKHTKFSHINPELTLGLLERGLLIKYVAAIYGCSIQTVTKQVKFYFPDFDGRKYFKCYKCDLSLEDTVKLYKQVRSITKLSEQYQISISAIAYRLEKAGVKRRSHLYRDDISNKTILALYHVFRNATIVAETMDIDPSLVRRRLKKAGIKLERNYETRRRPVRKQRRFPERAIVIAYQRSTIRNLAEEYHTAGSTIRDILIRNNVEIKRGRGKPHYRDDITPKKVAGLYQRYGSTSKVADLLSVSTYTIRRRLNEAGIKIENKFAPRRGYDLPEQEIIDLYKEGQSVFSLADRYHTSNLTINNILDDNDVKRRGRIWERDDILVEDVQELYALHRSMMCVAEILGVSLSLIRSRLRQSGRVPDKKYAHNWRDDIPKKEVVKMRKKGSTLKDIAEKYDSCTTTIRNILIGEGVAIKPYHA